MPPATIRPMPAMDAAALQRLLAESGFGGPPPYLVEDVGDWGVRLRLPVTSAHLRPGGTVSGPALMALADAAAWLAVLAQIGPVVLAVSTSLHIDFLRKPEPLDIVADGQLIKLGKSLAVIDVSIRSEGHDELVAKAQVTYSIPPGNRSTSNS